MRISYCKHIVQASPLPSPGERELNNYNNQIKFGFNHRNLRVPQRRRQAFGGRWIAIGIARKFSEMKAP